MTRGIRRTIDETEKLRKHLVKGGMDEANFRDGCSTKRISLRKRNFGNINSLTGVSEYYKSNYKSHDISGYALDLEAKIKKLNP